MNVSLFLPFKSKEGYKPGIKPKAELPCETYLEYVREGKWEQVVLNYRAGRVEKVSIPGVTPSGTFSHRAAGNIIHHSGIIALDFDAKDNEDFPADEIATSRFCWAMHRSVSGFGWVVYVKIDPERHLDAFLALEKHFANEYKVVADPSCKDVSRLRFVSYDPDLYLNTQAAVWKKYLPKKTVMPRGKYYVHTNNDIEHVINQIRAKGIDLTNEYHDWLKIGMGIASAYGENGREYFHQISSVSSKYNQQECDRKYTNFTKTNNGSVSIASFFWLAQLAGLDIKTKRTKHVERVAKMQRRVVGVNGGHKDKEAAAEAAKKVLNEVDMIYGPDVDGVIEQVMKIPDNALENEKSDDLIADVKEFLRTYDMKHNEVTRNIEIEGEPVNDRTFNSIYIRAMEILGTTGQKGKSVTKDLLFSIIDSDYTKGYNPFKDFFSKNSNLKPEGEIDKLLSSIKMNDLKLDDGRVLPGSEYLQCYARKWLLSCVASWHGTYSVMMMVLCGEQMNGKTNFFRWLLPEELRDYYAESTLDRGKDDEILMCQKAIICDDEYDGKSKQDYKKLKSLLSKQTFSIRKPYGKITEDLTRIAVLCGTSNEEEIINDPTGNRRIIPVQVETIDWDIYKTVDKTALWMELYHEWKATGDDWMMGKAEVKTLNKLTARNTKISTEEEAVFMFFDHPTNGGYVEHLTNTEIRNYIEMNSRLKLSQTKLGLILKKCGFKKHAMRSGVTVKQVYKVVKRRDS